jgi:outer membrane lipoprotein-sorting protein
MSPGRSPPVSRRTAAVVALAVALLLAGCSGALDGDPDLPDGDEAVERLSSVGVYNATLVTESTVGNETTETSIEHTIRPATGERYQVTRRDGNRTVLVSNETTTWVYQPAVNRVQRIQTVGQQQADRREQLRELIDSLDTDDETEAPIAPLLPVFGSRSVDDSSFSETTVRAEPMQAQYRGVETVNGRDAHVVRLETTPEAENEIRQTVYYDAEYFIVLQSEYEMTVEGDSVTGRTQVKSIDFDPSVDDEIFEFDPPENATVLNTSIEQYGNYTALSRASDGHVPDPDLPPEFEFDSGQRQGQNITLQYTSGVESVTVSRFVAAAELPGDLDTVDHQGRTYQYRDSPRGRLIRWECGDSLYTVSGDLERDTLLDVGASIDCPASDGG